jgi:hypothetical protein
MTALLIIPFDSHRDTLRRHPPSLPFCAVYSVVGWFMLTGQCEAVGISRCTRRSDASSRGLHEAGLCGAHRDRYGRGRLTRRGVLIVCAATPAKTPSAFSFGSRNTNCPVLPNGQPLYAVSFALKYSIMFRSGLGVDERHHRKV